MRRRDLGLPFAYPLLCLSSAFAKPKKDFFSFFTTRCRKNTSNRVLAVRRRDQEPPFAYPPLMSYIFFTEALNEIGDSI
jgi:hypothetical protein